MKVSESMYNLQARASKYKYAPKYKSHLKVNYVKLIKQ